MALKETLRLIIEGDNRGAVKAVKGVGDATSRELGKSQKSIDKWGQGFKRAGIGMIALGGAALVGLGALAKQSEEANLAQVKLDNTLANMPKLAGENSKQFTDLAQKIQDYSAADADAIVAGEAMLGTFNLTAKQIKGITPLVVDFSRKFGVDMVTASTMVGKALDGNVGALKRNGVSIDEVAFKTDRYGAVQKALSDQVGGFARAEGATFAGSLERMKNQLGDLAEGVGGGAVDAFTAMFGAVGKAAEALDKISPGAQNAAGKIATFGAVGLVAVGGLSSLIGVAIQASKNFSLLGSALAGIPARITGMIVPTVAVEGAFTGATVATSGFAVALGTLSAATGVIAALFALRQVLKSFKDDAPDPEDIAAVSKELTRLADTGESTGDALEDMFDKLAHPGDIEGTSKAIDLVDKGLAKLAAIDPKAAGAAFDHIISKLHEMTGESEKTLRASSMWDDYNQVLGATAGVQDATTGAVKETGGALEGQVGATEEATDALQEYEDELKGTLDPLFSMIDAMQDNSEALTAVNEKQSAYTKAVDAFGPSSKQAAAAAQELRDAQLASGKAGLDATSSMIELNAAVRDNPQLVNDAKAAVQQMARQHIISKSTAAALGRELDRTAQDALRLGRTDPRVDIRTTGIPTAKGRIKELIQMINGIPTHRTITIGVTTALGPQAARLAEAKLLGFASGGRVPGPVGKPKVIVAHGGEEIVPFHDKAAMARYRPMHGMPSMAAAGGLVKVDVNINGEGLMRYLRNQIQVETGGDVQAALGTRR